LFERWMRSWRRWRLMRDRNMSGKWND